MLFYSFLFCPYSTTHSPPSYCFLFPRQVPTSSFPQPKIIQKGTYKRFFELWDVTMNGHHVQGRYSSPSAKSVDRTKSEWGIAYFWDRNSVLCILVFNIFLGQSRRDNSQPRTLMKHTIYWMYWSHLQVWFKLPIVKNCAYDYAVAWKWASTTGVYICVSRWGGNVKLSLDGRETSLKSPFFSFMILSRVITRNPFLLCNPTALLCKDES